MANIRPSITPTICAVRLSLIKPILSVACRDPEVADEYFALLVKHSSADCA
jgi:hypothetical protein